EVVALTRAAVVVGPRVAGAEEHQILLRIVGPGHPDRSAAPHVRIAFRPRLAARFTRSGDGVETPRALAGLHIIRVDEPADPELGSSNPHDDLVLHDERGDRGG